MKLPFLYRYVAVLAAIVLTVYVLILGKDIAATLLVSLLLAILVVPMVSWFERRGVPRSVSSIIGVLVVIVVFGGIITILSFQVSRISEDLPRITEQLTARWEEFQRFITRTLGVREPEQSEYLSRFGENVMSSGGEFLSSTMDVTSSLFTAFALAPIALFFFLSYRDFFIGFLFRAVPRRSHGTLRKIKRGVNGVVRHYLIGRIIVIGIIFVLNTVGLLVAGVDYAFFWGALSAILTIIPFIGVFIGAALPVLYALLTKDSIWYAAGLAGWFWVVQWIEGDFIEPNVVGNQVRLNPFVTLIGLFIGAAIWGAIGMIVIIPVLAILKVIFDSIDRLEPYGYLLGQPKRKR